MAELQVGNVADAGNKIFHQVSEESDHPGTKVTIVGAGQVGMACAYSILNQVSASFSSFLVFHSSVLNLID
jgi:D-arabinose 1-dehydrogenase-like Zn-dependent alcohol dehydrogenase